MKIMRVILKNYRQYYGENEIILSTDPTKNMTIIQGPNGGGKSNFMNAICWCLYNKEIFKSTSNVNLPFLSEYAAKNTPVGEAPETSVTLYMGVDKEQYKFERKIIYSTDRNRYEKTISFHGWEISKTIGTNRIDKPEWFIEKNFLPEELCGFFFFDGEKMDKFFEDTVVIKPNVEKLAQIVSLKGAIDTLDSLSSTLWKEIKNYDKNDTDLPDDIGELTQTVKQNEQEIESLKRKVTEDTEAKREVDRFLSENSSTMVKELVDSRSGLEEQRTDVLNNLKQTNDAINSLLSSIYPIIFGYQAIKETKEIIDDNTKRGVLPPNIKDQFVEELLQTGICICGRNLDEDPNCRKNLEKLLESIVPNDIASDSQEGRYILTKLMEKANFVEKYSELHVKREELEGKKLGLVDEIERLTNKINQFDEKLIKLKETERAKLDLDIRRSSERIGMLEAEKKNAQRTLDLYEDAIRNSKIANEKGEHLKTMREYVQHLSKQMRVIKDNIVETVRKQLEEKTNAYFFELIWKKEAFQDVRILDNGAIYTISVRNDQGHECLGSLSAGERQVLALAFTAALYTVSGYTVPIFIDTPLGRISEAPRENVAQRLPKYLSNAQLIMLPTDTEYTAKIRNILSSSVGEEYKIAYNESQKTSEVVDFE